MKNQIIWILWLIMYILIFIAYDREPLKYSNKKLYDIISYSKIYLYLMFFILLLQTIYGIYLIDNFPLFYKINKYTLFSIGIIGLIIINSLKKKPIEDSNKFYLAPNNLNENLGFIYLLLIIIPIGLKLVTLYYNGNNLESNICIGISIIYIVKKIINNNYATCLYNLPKTFT